MDFGKIFMRQGILLGHFYATGYRVWRDLPRIPVTSLVKFQLPGLITLFFFVNEEFLFESPLISLFLPQPSSPTQGTGVHQRVEAFQKKAESPPPPNVTRSSSKKEYDYGSAELREKKINRDVVSNF